MMMITTMSIPVIRETEYGDEVSVLARIREPERDENGKAKYAEGGRLRFGEKSAMRTRMVADYLKKGIVPDVPKDLVTEVRDELFRYAETYPYRSSIMFTSVISDATRLHYDLETPDGRLRQLGLYLTAYKVLRSYERTGI